MAKTQLSKGGMTATIVDVRLMLKEALEQSATCLVLVHNHSSGSLVASVSDKQITQKLKRAAESLDIKVLYHLIVA